MRRRDERTRLPLRKSLLGRLLTVSALVASCSVAATAWLAVQTTSGAIRQEQGQNLIADAEIYNTLRGYAATHPDWEDVDDTVRRLARKSERRIVLTTQDRRPLADSTDGAKGASGTAPPAPLPPQASAVVDPLSVDTVLAPGAASAGTDRVDPRAVGPFLLPAKERKVLRKATTASVKCLSAAGVAADIVESPSGRPHVQYVSSDTDRSLELRCLTTSSAGPTATEKKALRALDQLADACLKRQGLTGVKLNLDLSWDRGYGPADTGNDGLSALPDGSGVTDEKWAAEQLAVQEKMAQDRATKQRASGGDRSVEALPTERSSKRDRAIASCVDSARREQLTSYVAAPALLFIDSPDAVSVPGFDLSPANTTRIAGAAALVLALTVGASVIAGARLVRPLHALTGAAQRMRDGLGSAPVPVGSDNEIGRLAATFNDMAAHRARLEEQRKAMVSDVAHELRTPLSNIRGWLEAAQDGLAEPDPAFVSSLHEEAVQLQHIIDDLQDLGAADAGVLRLHLEPVRVDDLLGQVAAAHQGLAETAGVTLTVSAAAPGTPPLPPLDADPVRLRQAVSNLLSNAVRHTPPGGRVTLRSYVTESESGSGSGSESGDEVAVEVSDTGSGIPEGDVPHVFDRFWRAEKSRNRSTGGSGLGLAIVLKLAEAHGGTASVVSTEGQGSVFTLRLPAAPDPGAEREKPGEAGEAGEAGTRP
ncbi:two-component system sensor histidine kinase BaeS [Streptomyces aurantiacus]|uniref:sensor histidine kinase n=1 Tax=Streptomyces aurantiacus TaxID=47760 RepID=UPI0027949BC7|nr:HAMP domain-containing sensor histidine kinase [Streptomyces aurantiacus]MDQ0779289.1 two-component system sensor histidine kinase BaeS [Streptomyces aurantiacus]